LWLSPIQVVLLPIADRHNEYAQTLKETLEKAGIRATVDNRQERLPSKIRDHTLQKVPFMGIIGDSEIADNAISVRSRDGDDLGKMQISQFLEQLQTQIEQKK
jgi:threonyl-tRNA synthetase